MKALTLRQPWAWAVTFGMDVEIRPGLAPWNAVGSLVAVHAGKGFDDVVLPTPAAIRAYLNAKRDQAPDIAVRGAVVAVARITGCHLDASCWNVTTGRVGFCSPWAVRDQCHWQLADVRVLRTPVLCRGALGLWTLPVDAEAAVRAQIGRAT